MLNTGAPSSEVAMISIKERRNAWKWQMLLGLLLVILGILMAIFQQDALEAILIVSGVLLIIAAVFVFIEAATEGFPAVGLLHGALYLILGVVLVLVPALVSDVLMVLLAVGLILVGLLSLLGISTFSITDTDSKIVNVIIAVIMIVMGILALFYLDDTADIVMIVIGVFVAIAGIVRCVGAYHMYEMFH